MKSLIFDLETTGKAKFDSSVKAVNQPHIVELAFELYCSEREEVMSKYSVLVNPDGVSISQAVTKIHGITNKMVKVYGVNEKIAVAVFFHHLFIADRLVCHNVTFDFFVMQAAFHRFRKPTDGMLLLQAPTFCTMLASTPICKLKGGKGKGKHKWPKLEEAYKMLVDEEGFEGGHRAAVDVTATRELMIVLENKEV